MKTTSRRPSDGIRIAAQCLTAGALLAAAPSLVLLLIVLLAPGLICLLADRTPIRGIARASLLAGAAASLAPAWRFCLNGISLDHAIAALENIRTIAFSWLGCSIGWLTAELAPIGVYLVIEARIERRRQRLALLRSQLIEEWNLKIPG